MNNINMYKAKDIKSGKWIEGFYLCRDETTYCVKEDYERFPINKLHFIAEECMTDWGLPNNFIVYQIDPDTLCRGTGQNDVNGHWLYEHDIIIDFHEEDDYLISEIQYDNKYSRFVICDYGVKGGFAENGYDEDYGEYGIVNKDGFSAFIPINEWACYKGNSFDNPEMLTREYIK